MLTYSELLKLSTYSDRLKYLKLDGHIGVDTFGFDRYLNQAFYQRSYEWKKARDYVIIRDEGCDLGIEGLPIFGRVIIHHMNPIAEIDILERNLDIIDPEFLVCTSIKTHNLIHYGMHNTLENDLLVERKENDTCPWR